MLYISFDSKTKFNGKCKISINTDKLIFDLINESSVLYCSYKLKPMTDMKNSFRFYFILETPHNESINIPANENTIRNTITYIMAKESNKSEKDLQMIIDYINHPEDFAVIDMEEEDE